MKKRFQLIGIMKLFTYSLIFVALTGFSFQANGQDISVSGIVKDAKGMTLPGVSVVNQGTTTGTTTDIDGKYTISVPSTATLVFSSIGFKTQTVQVNGATSINIDLKEDAELLEEVVVIGYGTRKKIPQYWCNCSGKGK